MTIMPYMTVGHEKSALAYTRDATTVLGAGIDRHPLANIAIGPNDQPGLTAAIAGRLRRRSKRSERTDDGAVTDCCQPGDVNVRHQPAIVTDLHARTDNAVWPNDGALPDDRTLAQAEILANWRDMSQKLTGYLDGWTEAELDTYQLPHLLMSMMTKREMLIFTLYHNLHHLEDAKRLAEARQ